MTFVRRELTLAPGNKVRLCDRLIDLKDYAATVAELRSSKTRFAELPSELLSLRSPALPAPQRLKTMPSYQKLHPYQKKGVQFIVRRNGRGIIGDEMGLGKTFQAACVIDFYACSTVVVCPSSLKTNWKREYQKATGSDDLHVLNNGKDAFAEKTVLSYSLLNSLKKLPLPELLVCDESHYVKEEKSKRTKKILAMAARCKHVLLLSGTPSSLPKDLYTQLKCVAPDIFKNFYEWRGRLKKSQFYFAERYCDPQKVFIGQGDFRYVFNGCTRSEELHAVLEHFMVRRRKEDVLDELPEKTRYKVILEALSNKKQAWFADQSAELDMVRETEGKHKADVQLLKMVKETSRLKQPHVVQYVKTLCERSGKFLLFAHHHEMLDAVCDALRKKGAPFINIDGRTPRKRRDALVQSFQERGEVRFAVLGIRAAGTGVNLQAANHVVFCELVWNSKDMLQAEDRAHRLGQTRAVNVQYLVLEGSTDDFVWRSINKKVLASTSVLENKRKRLNAKTVRPTFKKIKNL